MLIELTPTEREILLYMLGREVDDTGAELRRTDAFEYRDDLKEHRHVIRDLLARLEKVPVGT